MLPHRTAFDLLLGLALNVPMILTLAKSTRSCGLESKDERRTRRKNSAAMNVEMKADQIKRQIQELKDNEFKHRFDRQKELKAQILQDFELLKEISAEKKARREQQKMGDKKKAGKDRANKEKKAEAKATAAAQNAAVDKAEKEQKAKDKAAKVRCSTTTTTAERRSSSPASWSLRFSLSCTPC